MNPVNPTTQKLVTRISALLTKAEAVLQTHKNYGIGHDYVDSGLYAAFRTQAVTCLNDLLGPDHTYTLAVGTAYIATYNNPENVNVICGILSSFKEDLENGYIQTVKELVHAEVFTDFIEMAETLLATAYKDAAAVIIGSVLENHLRCLCIKNGIDCTFLDKNGKQSNKKASTLNEDLTKTGVYLMTSQKQVIAWLDIRNNAAHGHYDKYNKDQVNLMIQGVTGFLAQFPA